MTNQPSNRELLHQLYRALLVCLRERIEQPNVGPDYLAVTRRLLKDQGFLGFTSGDAERERLQAMYRSYVDRLAEALRVDRPSAAILMEAHRFLESQGIRKDLGAAVDKATALHALKDQRLPFTNHLA